MAAAQVAEGAVKLIAASCGPSALESEMCVRVLAGAPSPVAARAPAVMKLCLYSKIGRPDHRWHRFLERFIWHQQKMFYTLLVTAAQCLMHQACTVQSSPCKSDGTACSLHQQASLGFRF